MDYSFNMLACLDTNAILITNGDNDTYPGWILTRILRLRRDVNIVNRALLSSEWYPMWIMNEGVPTFISKVDLDSLRNNIFEGNKGQEDSIPGRRDVRGHIDREIDRRSQSVGPAGVFCGNDG